MTGVLHERARRLTSVIVRRGLLVWLLIMGAEFVHGIARTVLLQPYVGDFRARQVAVFTGSVIILAVALVCVRWIGAATTRELLGVGGLWLVLTVAFEILLGRLVMGYSWLRIGSDYNLIEGGLLPIGLAILTLSPLLAAHLRRVRAS
jgi:hypothetical protein